MQPPAAEVEFRRNERPFTLGAEIELQVIDRDKLILTPRAPEVLSESGLPFLTSELFKSTLECVSPVCDRVHELSRVFSDLFMQLSKWGAQSGLAFVSAGTHPLADYRDRLITPSMRYEKLLAKNQWLIRRRAVYGLHVHLGMISGEMCIRFANFFLHFIPHLIALAASSPFWQRMNTGLIACRPTFFESLPTAGLPYRVATWNQFQRIYTALMRSASIDSFKDLSWDLRPSLRHGTLEIRVCDATSLRETLAIVAFIQTLALWYSDHPQDFDTSVNQRHAWIIRENKWRAIRSGLDAGILVNEMGDTRSLRKEIETWVDRLACYYEQNGYHEYRAHLLHILQAGNSAQRQVAEFERHQNFADVVRMNVEEFLNSGTSRIA